MILDYWYLENPITTEIIRNALISTADEMNTSLFRSAYSPIIYEMKDCSVCLFNKNVELLAQSAGLPIFLGNLDECIDTTTKLIGGMENYNEGDVYIMNDSYITGAHLNDITVFSPIFYKNKLVGFAATRAHWLDVGGKDPGGPMDSIDIYQEGIRIPPIKIYEKGFPRQDVIALITRNSRFKESVLGDLNAQIAACRTGEMRFKEIIKKFGLETVERCISDIFKQSERIDSNVISKIPDGEYKAEGYLDNDGFSDDPVLVKVKVIITGESITIDLTGSSKQVQGMTNCGMAQTIAACRVAFKDLISPDSPVTEGNFKKMEVIAPEKTIFNAKEPAACQWYFGSLGLLIDLIIKALSPVLKEQSVAAHFGDSMIVAFSGQGERTNELYYIAETNAGGWGGFMGNDGESGLINHVNGDLKNLPVEILESKYPLKVEKYGFRSDTGGPGIQRGGLGIKRAYQVLNNNTKVALWFDRTKTPAWGLFGGKSGKEPEVFIHDGDNVKRFYKLNATPLNKGSRVVIKTGGGGGFGHPFNRDPDLVLQDVIDGYISKGAARDKYGVILEKGLFKVNYRKTSNYRNKCR